LIYIGDNGWHVERALNFIEDSLPGVYVISLRIGSNIAKVNKYPKAWCMNGDDGLVN